MLNRVWTGIVGAVCGACIALVALVVLFMLGRQPNILLLVAGCAGVGLLLGFVTGNRRSGG